MGFVLAVEPDTAQAEVLRRCVRRVDAELEVVSTTDAAIDSLSRSIPDLILVSALLSPRDEDALFAHLRTLHGSAHLQTLTIPQLNAQRTKKSTAVKGRGWFKKQAAAEEAAGCDPTVFAAEVATYLAKARDLDRAPLGSSVISPPQKLGPGVIFSAEPTDLAKIVPEADAAAGPEVEASPVPKMTPGPNFDGPDLDDPWMELDVDALAERLGLQSGRVEVQEDAAPLAVDVQQFELRAQAQREEELARAEAEAQAYLAAEVERVQREGEERRSAELARLQAEAEAERDAAVLRARAEAESEARTALAAEIARAREAVEAESAQAMTEELARVRAEVEQRLNDELERARAETERLRQAELTRAQAEAAALREAAALEARQATESMAAQALEVEVARVRADAETRLREELRVLREEAEHARLADQTEAKQTVDKVREAAIRDTRAIAEAANHTLETELARVRAEADARLEAELTKARSVADAQRSVELDEIRAQVAEMREAAARQARAASAQALAERIAAPAPPKPEPKIEKTTFTLEPIATPPRVDYLSLWNEREAEKGQGVKGKGQEQVSPSKWTFPIAAGLLLVVGGTILLGWSWRPATAPPTPIRAAAPAPIAAARTSESAQRFGGAEITTSPAGARVLLDGTDVGVTPASLSKLKAGRHTLVLRSASGTITRKIDIRGGETTRISESIFSGWIAVFSAIPVTVSINGHAVGSSNEAQIMLAPGAYNVELTNDEFKYRETTPLKVEPGQVTSYSISLPTSPVHVAAPDGTNISIDGQAAGQTPLADLSLTIGSHEVVARYPDASEKRQSIEVKYGEGAEISLK